MARGQNSLMRASLVVGVATAGSRILGFVRDILIAAALGAGPVADALLVALRLPNLARRALGEGGVNAGFVPLHARIATERGEEAAREFTGRAISVASISLLVLAIILHAAAGALVLAMASGYLGEGGSFALTTHLTRLALPAVALLTLAALLAAILNAQRRFVAAALAPLVVNFALIAVLVAPLHDDPAALARALALAFSLGALVQLAVLVVALRRARPDLRLRAPRLNADMRRLATIGVSGLLAASASQLILLAAFQAASYTPGAVSHLHYADRLFQLPLGLIGVAVGIVLLPEIAARLRARDAKGFHAATNEALEGSMLLALPAAAALLVLAEPMTAVLFERGAFTAEDRLVTAAILAGLACGLPFAVASKVLAQGLFAGERVRAASLAGLAGIIAALLACAALSALLGPIGLGLGAAFAFAVQAGAIGAALAADGAWRATRSFAIRMARIAAATLAMSAGLVALRLAVDVWSTALLAAACIGGLGLYLVAARLTGAITRADLARLRRRG
jgi:putative peptidoglycan lipid II flippase